MYINIINYNKCNKTLECIGDILNCLLPEETTVNILDNSNTSEVDCLKNGIHSLLRKYNIANNKVIFNVENVNKNIGFGAGHNYLIKNKVKKGNDIIIILNNDVSIKDPGFFKKIHTSVKQDNIISPVICTENNHIWNSGGVINKFTGDLKINRRIIIGETDFISGCCMAMTYNTFAMLNGFDEKYFMYSEDFDLSVRAKKHGVKLEVINLLLQHDVGSGEKGNYSNIYLFEGTKNKLLCIKDNSLGIRGINYVNYIFKYLVLRSIQLLIYSKTPIKDILLVFKGIYKGFQ